MIAGPVRDPPRRFAMTGLDWRLGGLTRLWDPKWSEDMRARFVGSIVEKRRAPRDLPLEALQFLADLGVGLDDTAALSRVSEGLRYGVSKCCIAFTLFYGRTVDAGRQDLVAGYGTWMNRLNVGQLGYVPCPRCLLEGSFVRAAPTPHPAEKR
jgi:hypothetical protein